MLNLENETLEDRLHVYRLVAAFILSAIIVIGSFVIIIVPTAQATTNAAVAFVSSIITGWTTYLMRTHPSELKAIGDAARRGTSNQNPS